MYIWAKRSQQNPRNPYLARKETVIIYNCMKKRGNQFIPSRGKYFHHSLRSTSTLRESTV
eukprot:scaffold42992_cov13-Prasinocladus_malaysianus.AAC.1